MTNLSYSVNHLQDDSLIKSAVDPLRFLELKKLDIIFRLTKDNEYSEEEACLLFHSLKEMATRLKKLRAYQSLTFAYLEETIKRLSFKVKSITLLFLIKATSPAKSYSHAFNSLAQIANPDLPFPIYPKLIPEHEILSMIERENAAEVQNFENNLDEDDLPKTFKSNFNPEQLIKIKGKMIGEIISKISDDDFVYLLTEKPITENMRRLYWKESLPLCHAFLTKVVYGAGQFNFKQVNECIKFPDGKKLDSNHKTSSYRNNDILDPILKV